MLSEDTWFTITIIGCILVFVTSSIVVGVFLFNTMAYHNAHQIVDATPWLVILGIPASVVGFAYLMTNYVDHQK